MPVLQMGLFGGDAQADHLAKINGTEGKNVGDGEAFPRNIGHFGKTGIELVKPDLSLLLALLPPFGEDPLPVFVKTRSTC